MSKSLPRAAAFGGTEGTNETGTHPAQVSTPSMHVFGRSISLSREPGSRPLCSQQDTPYLPPGHKAPVPHSHCRQSCRRPPAAATLPSTGTPLHATRALHQHNKTRSTKRCQNLLNPYLAWVLHQKFSFMSSSLYWGPESTLDTAVVTVKLIR